MMSSEEKYLQYDGLLLPKVCHSAQSLKFAQEFTFRDDDVVAATYPKSGTTWMQEILPLVLNGGDLTPIHTIPNWDRVPWLEEERLEEVVDQLTPPRAFVSHFPYHVMPPSFHSSKAKVIYVMRNPKDVIVSSYYFHQMATFLQDPGTFDEFIDKFLEGRVLFGKWTDHVKSWKNSGLGDRLMFTTYEEMIETAANKSMHTVMGGLFKSVDNQVPDREKNMHPRRASELGSRGQVGMLFPDPTYKSYSLTAFKGLQDFPAVLRKMSDFLGSNLSEEVIQKIAEHCSFKSMKVNSMSNFSLVSKQYMDSEKSPFLRKGIAGDWKNHFSSEQLARFSSVIRKELENESFCLPWNLD